MESNIDLFMRSVVYEEMDKVRNEIAKYINADDEDIVFVDNASHGVNSVLRSIQIPKGKKILYLNVAYGMVKNCLRYLEEVDKDQLLEVKIALPGTNNEIIEAIRKALSDNDVYLAVFSQITSVPAMILPTGEIIKTCQEFNVLTLVDAAHAIGAVPINIKALNPDFWLANGHKWLFTPKGTAVLYVRKDFQEIIEPTTISWLGQGNTKFQRAFSWVGTQSYSRYLAMTKSMELRQELGDNNCMNYMHDLAVKTGKVLSQMWGTHTLFSDSNRISSMVNVRLPTKNKEIAFNIPAELQKKYSTYAPVYDLEQFGNVRENEEG